MDQRSTSTAGYRYCYNGKENDNEVKGEGNQQDYGFRIYDPRVARFLSVDPLAGEFAGWSPFHFSANSPIIIKDADGQQWFVTAIAGSKLGSSAHVTMATFHKVVGLLFNNKIVARVDAVGGVSLEFSPGMSEILLNSGERILYDVMKRAILSPVMVRHGLLSDHGDITVSSFQADPRAPGSPGLIDVGDIARVAAVDGGKNLAIAFLSHEVAEQHSRMQGMSYDEAHRLAIEGPEMAVLGFQRFFESGDPSGKPGKTRTTHMYWNTSDERSWLGKSFVGRIAWGLGLYEYPHSLRIKITETRAEGGAPATIEIGTGNQEEGP